jgi:aspartate/tyrosine/aromatic aminotransferase
MEEIRQIAEEIDRRLKIEKLSENNQNWQNEIQNRRTRLAKLRQKITIQIKSLLTDPIFK